MPEFEKKKEYFERLFSIIPMSLIVFKSLKDENDNLFNYEKKLRYKYLYNIYHNVGIDTYYNLTTEQNPDFYYNAEPSYLFHFENLNQLNEWIISGLNLKHQNSIFKNNNDETSSEEDFIDSP